MKVTALIPDQLIDEAKLLSGGKNTTEAIIIALNEWIALKKVKLLTQNIRKAPFQFKTGFSASKTRSINRK